jgi:REP element-mobilizing transposase RayT
MGNEEIAGLMDAFMTNSALFKMRDRHQLELPMFTWGGARKGAGRKPGPGRRPTPHRARLVHRASHPVHLTLRARPGLPSLRRPAVYRVVAECISKASNPQFRVVHFSVQRDHLHMLVEASDKRALSGGARGLAIRSARRLNRHLGLRGKVWGDRYHTRAMTTPTEVRRALVYVLMNIKKHSPVACDGVDPCSSALWFDGFTPDRAPIASRDPPPVHSPRTWLAAHGWRRRGLIDPREFPRLLP